MEFPEKQPIDVVFGEAIRNQPSFLSRLEGAITYDDIRYAIEKAAVTDEVGEKVVFDIRGLEGDRESEDVDAFTSTLEELLSAVTFIEQNGAQHIDEVHEIIGNKVVAEAVGRIISNT